MVTSKFVVNVDTDYVRKTYTCKVGDRIEFVRENAPNASTKASWGIGWSGGKSEADRPYETDGPSITGTIVVLFIKSGMSIELYCDYEGTRTFYDVEVYD